VRDENAIYLNSLLSALTGIKPMKRDKRETKKHIIIFLSGIIKSNSKIYR